MLEDSKEYWDNLERNLELKRLQKQKEKELYWKSKDGQIKAAFNNFCLWCRCNERDPYKDTFNQLKIYLDENNDPTYKGDDRILFQEQTPEYVENKKMLRDLILNKEG